MKNIRPVLLALALALGLVGCNTIRGIGMDIERAGEAIQKAGKS